MISQLLLCNVPQHIFESYSYLSISIFRYSTIPLHCIILLHNIYFRGLVTSYFADYVTSEPESKTQILTITEMRQIRSDTVKYVWLNDL